MKNMNKHRRDISSEKGSSDDDDDDDDGRGGAKRMRKDAGFEQNMAWKSVHGHAPPKAEGDSDR